MSKNKRHITIIDISNVQRIEKTCNVIKCMDTSKIASHKWHCIFWCLSTSTQQTMSKRLFVFVFHHNACINRLKHTCLQCAVSIPARTMKVDVWCLDTSQTSKKNESSHLKICCLQLPPQLSNEAPSREVPKVLKLILLSCYWQDSAKRSAQISSYRFITNPGDQKMSFALTKNFKFVNNTNHSTNIKHIMLYKKNVIWDNLIHKYHSTINDLPNEKNQMDTCPCKSLFLYRIDRCAAAYRKT